jgi:predicted ATPase
MELLERASELDGVLAALLAAGSSRERLFAALLDELDQGTRPQVVVVEDAHWADEATLDLLRFSPPRSVPRPP